MFELGEEVKIALGAGMGMWAFILHRISGLALIFYLLLHVLVISTSLSGPAAFNKLLAILTSPFFLTLDLGLLAAILFHALNGIRILLFDLGIGIRVQKPLFLAVVIVAFILWTLTFYLTLPYILGKAHG